MQKFRNPFSVPPGRRWFYKVPGGRFVESVFGIDDCALRAAAAYRELNQDVPGNLTELIQDFMCQSLPDGFCTGKPTISNPTWFQTKNSTEDLVKHAKLAGKFGPQLMQVLESRAGACQNCAQHDLHSCTTCNGLMAAFEEVRRGRRTPFDRNLRVCRACAGLLPVVIQIDADAMRPLPGFQFPSGCWVTKELAHG